ncbi:MAG: hypothetical protein F6J90_29255 [Moorea sp. SIOASIH]|uniref:hypothetical protein n=1 Tax=Moorena sp. SIOASIH TaxID=2607817 RepID=UPI0013B6C905|nr:hypothetical protein [Moorena sp. SIOASIH]NEO40212.1 hypothetical protein [Moorena sp. SIOASIH]
MRSRSVAYGQSLLAEAEAVGHASRTLHRTSAEAEAYGQSLLAAPKDHRKALTLSANPTSQWPELVFEIDTSSKSCSSKLLPIPYSLLPTPYSLFDRRAHLAPSGHCEY